LVEGEREERSTGPLDFVLEELAIRKQHKKRTIKETERKKAKRTFRTLLLLASPL